MTVPLPTATPIKHDQSRQQCPKLLAKRKVPSWTDDSIAFTHPSSSFDVRIVREHTS
ncbi:hypothetical protein GJ744_001008 [Endocarpon pusillum]|uniref:Uncharacterized protein n=1 Tax=Endocarpon pusillum TaxID=364733 RepID=A0A8H7AE32_9EURO|nr:hypothetical protein GJ744_001008 [Endocarpon pusillum]